MATPPNRRRERYHPDWELVKVADRPGTPNVDVPVARTVRRLYHPDGSVLLSISDRPPVGFHQGQRGVSR